MSGKLDQALDDITQAQRRSARRRPNQRRGAGRPAVAAPVGGIQKSTKPARGTGAKPAPAKATPTNSDSKIIVSNLPKDVSEQQIKRRLFRVEACHNDMRILPLESRIYFSEQAEYFIQSVGPIKRVELSYGPNSQSRGIANVTFHKSDGASKAFQKLNGLLVDNRPIKIEIVVGAAQADKVIPTVKTLAERTTQPKAQPKSAAADKHNAGAAKGAAAKGAAGKKRRGRNSRPAKKTQEELDSEMADYFDASAAPEASNNAAAPAPAPAATGDADMDEIAVCNVVLDLHS
ncbi:mRNA export protein mlo3 [Fusarium odoratissimum]|uniref:mRNA export protein mlo3 n=1 Tax=Fusarium oxysporum f. sp. cubense (strain race 4) TaxID=2502994 RepID=N1S339_FUSC4|nr:mRNA export protein mlo3 [Fusarium odoratissimum]